MGQYYMPTLISEDGTVRTLYSHAYDNGLKLMEHSYIGNNFVNAVLTLLWKALAVSPGSAIIPTSNTAIRMKQSCPMKTSCSITRLHGVINGKRCK